MAPFNLQDLAGLSKPLEKLIDAVSCGIGKSCNPLLVLANAKADSIKIKQISKALDSATNNSSNLRSIEYNDGSIKMFQQGQSADSLFSKEELAERTQTRTAHQEIKKQFNIDSIVLNAALEIDNGADTDDTPIDIDWVDRFFDKAQHISNHTMQKIWSKVLAGETVKPGTYSLRTLDVLSNMTIIEAEAFRTIARFNFSGVIFKKAFGENTPHSELIMLKELGLLSPDSFLQANYSLSKSHEIVFPYFDKVIIVSNEHEKNISLQVDKFTRVGLDLINLTDVDPDIEYFNKVVQLFKSFGSNCFTADIVKRSAGKIQTVNRITV